MSSGACAIARALDPRIEPGEIDELRPPLVGALRDRTDEPLLAGRTAQRHDLTGLEVGTEVDGELGEACEGDIVHGTASRSWCEDAAVPPRYRHVLVAFDGSPEAELALAHAVAIAQIYRARLALVAVVPPPPLLAWQAPGGMRAVHDSEQAELEPRTCARPRTACPTTSRVTTQLLDGDPARELLRAAREGEHDVIVMGSRGRGRVTDGAARQRLQPRDARRRGAGDRHSPAALRRGPDLAA